MEVRETCLRLAASPAVLYDRIPGTASRMIPSFQKHPYCRLVLSSVRDLISFSKQVCISYLGSPKIDRNDCFASSNDAL